MNVSVDWNKLVKLPGDNDKCFEEFCYHIAKHIFGDYGTMSYFYNTPGSEFYVELNRQIEYAGLKYEVGDVIGWQCKFWRGAHDDGNSPLGSAHIDELADGFQTSLKRKPNIKLWIVCTPGAFVEDQWEKLIKRLTTVKNDCSFESWHKAVFHGLYLDDIGKYNGVFHYYFSEHVGKQQLDEITKDTLETLKNKFDLELHTPTDFEDSLLTIVDNEKARMLLIKRIDAVVSRAKKDKEKPVFNEKSWIYSRLTKAYKEIYADDITTRYSLCDKLNSYLSDDNILEKADEIRQLIDEYRVKRQDRVKLLNNELRLLRDNNKDIGSLSYVVSEMIERVTSLESIITTDRNKNNTSILDILNRISTKDFSVFSEAGHGKTHFACSVATNMIKRGKPAILLTGSQFRYCNGCESKLLELLQMPEGSAIGDALDILDYLAEIYQCRLPIIIDGLNESAPNEKRWMNELPPLRRKIRDRQNLVLITTCREKEEYITNIYGCKNYTKTDHPILLPGIERRNLQTAVAKYFNKYNIHPNTLSAHNLFTNPLLLKIFCETNKNRGSFDVNDHTLATCMKDYSDQLITSIAMIDGKHDRLLHHKIEVGLNKIARMIWERNERSVDFYEDFAKVFENQTESFLNEGLCFMLDCVGGEAKIQFSYDLVAGYHIAKAIVDDNKTADEFCRFVDKYYSRLFGDDRHTLAEDIIKSLFYLVPMRYGTEWFELMPKTDIAIAVMDHLDIIAYEESGRVAFAKLIANDMDNSDAKEKMCDCLYGRVYLQNNLLHFRIFLPFFNSMNVKEMDAFWNCRFAGYGVLSNMVSVFHDKYWAERYNLEDKISLGLLLCGIVDREFRTIFVNELFLLVMSNQECGLAICNEAICNNDPFVFEAVVSVITGVGLRTKEVSIVNECIFMLEKYLETHTSNPVFLLDDLETLYSYGEQRLGMTFDRSVLYKNRSEQWPVANVKDYSIYPLFDYDYDKYNIRPLIEDGWDRKAVLNPDEVYGMLLKRVLDYGYDEGKYTEIQEKENKNVNYRQNLRLGYGEKLGKSAVKELYGWLLTNGKLGVEYKNTFRSDIVEIDPTFPRIETKRTLVSKSLLVKDISRLSEWIVSSDIGFMEKLFITMLPKKNNKWVLLRGYFKQQVDEKFSSIYMSGVSQLVPVVMKEDDVDKSGMREEISYDHAFMGEMGWRHLETEEDVNYDSTLPTLLARYSFSDWSMERLQYPTIYLLNEEIVKRIGLEFDINTLEYSLGGELVSARFFNDTDQFFYLRMDVLDMIIKEYNAKICHHIVECRMVDKSLPSEVPQMKNRCVRNKKDVYYELRN